MKVDIFCRGGCENGCFSLEIFLESISTLFHVFLRPAILKKSRFSRGLRFVWLRDTFSHIVYHIPVGFEHIFHLVLTFVIFCPYRFSSHFSHRSSKSNYPNLNFERSKKSFKAPVSKAPGTRNALVENFNWVLDRKRALQNFDF